MNKKVEEFKRLFLKLHRITALIEDTWEYAMCNSLLDDSQLEKLHNQFDLYEYEQAVLQEIGIDPAVLKDWSVRKYENEVLKWVRKEEKSPEMVEVVSNIWTFKKDLGGENGNKG